jgi:hypothetical protein
MFTGTGLDRALKQLFCFSLVQVALPAIFGIPGCWPPSSFSRIASARSKSGRASYQPAGRSVIRVFAHEKTYDNVLYHS